MGLSPGMRNNEGGQKAVRLTRYRVPWAPHGARLRLKSKDTPRNFKFPKISPKKGKKLSKRSGLGYDKVAIVDSLRVPIIVNDGVGPPNGVKSKSNRMRQLIEQARSSTEADQQNAQNAGAASHVAGKRSEDQEAIEERQADESRACVRSVLAAVHSSRRADKAAGKRVTLSPASPTVHIVEISVEEWRGKKLAVQQVAENVQQHMRDWAIEKSLDRSKSNQQWWAEKNEEGGALSSVPSKDGPQDTSLLEVSQSPSAESEESPKEIEISTDNPSSKQSEDMEMTTPGSTFADACPKEAVVGRKGIAPLDPALISSMAPGSGGRKGMVPLETAVLSPPKEASAVGRKGDGGDGLDEEMDFSVPPQTPPPVGPKEATGVVSKDTSSVASKQTEDTEVTISAPFADPCPKDVLMGRKGIAPLDPALLSSVPPSSGGRIGMVPLDSAGLSPLKEASAVSRKGRRWCEEVKSSTSRWSDGLDEEMDFSVPPQTPPPVGPKEATGAVSKDTCGASSKQSENMEPLTPVHALSESCPKEAVVGRKGIAPLDPAVISSIAPPAVARKGVVPLEPAGLSPLKEASTVSRKGRRWCEEVKVSTRRWSEVLDEEMDFSVPPQTPPLVGIKEAAGAESQWRPDDNGEHVTPTRPPSGPAPLLQHGPAYANLRLQSNSTVLENAMPMHAGLPLAILKDSGVAASASIPRSCQWSEDLESEMDFSVPPTGPHPKPLPSEADRGPPTVSRSILRDAGAKVEPNVGSTVPMCSHTLLPQILTPTPTSSGVADECAVLWLL
eukprot:CAMPEP_0174300636 /NCGR_PEP_ID=MMETSP0809-20121228/58579_1 /TAXON_ID=73025 ORGANISM="Eutreptiella gymnastica-like, Strain CCMP1594" /NCGR_SAMPLE_ID=MMETSP0809 /ASSEMBLY_ACC=CAM_ASM_000658 /LENGTH=784 /DNA_ID=CAMNT_0015406249 /DNA_START=43 /DNA_END=2399 /DNA_ORIENTATION=-